MSDEEDEIPDDYALVEGEDADGNTTHLFWHEIEDAISDAEQIRVEREAADTFLDAFDVEIDDEGYLRHATGEYVTPHVFTRIDDGDGTFTPIRDVFYDSVDDPLEERMEHPPDRLHIDDLYGVADHAGEAVFVYDHWPAVLEMRLAGVGLRIRSAWQDSTGLVDEPREED